ncbi:hypothetical protein K9U39_08280 [Rhodoblastus acidophilus]|uniref:DUF2029 domain-containing protein n=1 Tax=Candidatus Rhodoblastus alkanivorans TaxID=2954117 RepID=A0ABS9Z8W2_9HYPH|nr:hypothetical protein [Candidatus Rhodoblastus alkanivorans]MCI4678369.1 hypothetical protein [Candidatus Rhodoblastus alkanivorans]MCI4683627.1 hypothetical protein [Candidatus Rhodoblastus alkanivorans]MDI4640943.1 hypothetical protein [Rhodoblastus acidophilus]
MSEQARQSHSFSAAAPPAGRLSSLWETPEGATLIFGGLCFTAFALSVLVPVDNLAMIFLFKQDRWLLLAGIVSLLAAGFRLGARTAPLRLSGAALVAMVAGVAAFCYFGHYFILSGYDLSRDEQMADFDAAIFAKGLLAQPLPPFWQAHAGALNTMFMLPVAKPTAWVSAYLPMNALLRTLAGFAGDPALAGPVLTALGAFAIWKCARLLWPKEPEPAIVAALLYCTSGQILFAGMTAYAMPAHLTLNLLWLWLFLLNRRAADAGALVLAFVSTGLHQPLFHPLFAAPFLFGLLRDRAWPRAALFAAGYAAICAFWLAWPLYMHGLVTGPASVTAPMGTDFGTRLIEILSLDGSERWTMMAANLLRFAAWQPVLLLPLAAAALIFSRRARYTLPLAASAVLPVLVALVILPYQGHGFGYRYLHPVLGPAILLAAQGWRSLADRLWLRPLTLRTTFISLLTVLPLQLWFSYGLYAATAQANARIAASKADFVVIGSKDEPFAADLVHNRPDLSSRPLRILADFLDDDLIAALCRDGATAALPEDSLYRSIDVYFQSAPDEGTQKRIATLSPRIEAAGCKVERLGALHFAAGVNRYSGQAGR